MHNHVEPNTSRTKSPQPTSYGRGVFCEISSLNTAIAGGWVQTLVGEFFRHDIMSDTYWQTIYLAHPALDETERTLVGSLILHKQGDIPPEWGPLLDRFLPLDDTRNSGEILQTKLLKGVSDTLRSGQPVVLEDGSELWVIRV